MSVCVHYGQGIPDLIGGETMYSYLHLMVGRHKSKDGGGGKKRKSLRHPSG